MAIDSAAKRASVTGFPGIMFPPPDGTIAASDRAHVTGFYAGLTYASLADPFTVYADGNPIRITGVTGSSEEIVARFIHKVKFIRWYNPATSGDLCAIQDGAGCEIISMNAEANNDTQHWPLDIGVDGLYCDDLDSGELYIYI